MNPVHEAVRALLSISLTLSVAILFTGCESDSSEPDTVSEPARTAAGGLAWTTPDDPAIFGDDFNYTLSELPESGEAESTPWTGSYWPTFMDSINYPWEGEGTDSPTAKYAAAFERTGLEDRISEQYGIESIAHNEANEESSTGKPCTENDECNSDVGETCAKRVDAEEGRCIPTWFGLCHAWAPAAVMVAEPEQPVVYNDVTFKVNDLKALATFSYTAGLAVKFVSLRCNLDGSDEDFAKDEYGSPEDETCKDTNAGTFHVIVSNLLGIQKISFIEDRTYDWEVWNQPVRSYEVLENQEMTAQEANTALGAEALGETYGFNDDAVSWRYISMTLSYITESPITLDGNLASKIDDYTVEEHYTYVLELDGEGKIIGGEWAGDSKTNHPDFLWYGTTKKDMELARENYKAGTGIKTQDITMLLELAKTVAPEVTNGFVWGDACSDGEGDFSQEIPLKETINVGEVPVEKANVRIDLLSDEDVDIQLIDKETGHEIIAWPSGDLNGSGEACTTYEGLEYCYSGYNGVGGELGHEWIEIKGVSNRPMIMKAYGYKAGEAQINYSWESAPDCVDAGSGTFSQEIEKDGVVDVGVIPAGKSNIKVKLSCENDVDIQLYDGETAIVMWPDGLLSGAGEDSVEYEGMTVHYSGYNGDGTGLGMEYITVEGTVSVDLTMKAYGYAAGDAQVDYFWGLSAEELAAP
ncbi:MAG: hypothetical protein CL940_00065 [Deltaproteobacteria bacterium]|nr:hypothetical protein [Deltaproteobacteria bacterium]